MSIVDLQLSGHSYGEQVILPILGPPCLPPLARESILAAFARSVVAAKAFACGVPVLASATGVMEQMVTDGQTGLTFCPGEPQDLAAKTKWAWTHEAEMDIMGHNARKEYEAKYTSDQNYRMLMDIYRQAVLDCEAAPDYSRLGCKLQP